jgi:hypothetical protein
MKISDQLNVLSQIINFLVFIYFVLELIKINAMTYAGLFIGALSILISVIMSIIAVFDE